ncbi:alanine racemase [Agromyces mediolanus]|uniref:Alanine racemase n=1 Tax=Agromyces mediolanus TaxID=41986 RepID=A0A918F7A4_AGRME|nr:alanine racemase [Agromyces mediolanus]GGR15455.1 alanine racemase [Agromyces mediolanus]GLJ73506.1 alanine racemase [Agromyces mediolanus]
MTERPFREALIDLDAVTANVRTLAERLGTPAMAVVKADAYGHGAVPVARAALAGGAAWLGTADLGEAFELRAAGIDAPILAWLHDPGADFGPAIDAGIDLGLSAEAQLHRAADAARTAGRPAAVHLKIDTGLRRNGVQPDEWAGAVAAAAQLERAGLVRIRGIFSHLANTSAEADAAQLAAFERALAVAAEAGLRPELRHIASTAGALTRPEARYDLVRLGIACYGIPPFADGTTSAELGLVPVMTLRGRVAAVRRIAAGDGVSYGHTWRAERPTKLALVPLGYADGIPRQASGRGEVLLAGARRPVVGRIAMDQFLVDVGDDAVEVGDEVVLFGDPATGAPSADDWGVAADTIGYEIVTRIGPRVPRGYLGGA